MIRSCLSGMRVVDFTQIGAGPTCTMLLADLGADVIKIEPIAGDLARKLGPPWYGDESPIFVAFNRGKRSLALDLKTNEGRDLAMRLIMACDIVVESFRPGVLARLGLDYESVRQHNSGVIYCSVSGYGQSGPYAGRPGVDGIMQAVSGLMGLIGSEGSEPSKVQAPIVDVFSGYVAAVGVLAQIASRELKGTSGAVDVSLFASAIALQQSAVTAYIGDGQQPAKIGSAAPYSAPNEAFKTADGWLMVAAYIGDRWSRLCKVLGRPELIDDVRFATSADRLAHRQEMFAALNEAFKTKSTDEWLALLEADDILCGRVAEYSDLLDHPQLQHLNLVIEMQQGTKQPLRTVGLPINSTASNAIGYKHPPALGAHSREIMREIGMSEEDIRALVDRGIVSAAPGDNAHLVKSR